ncbi:hypothetical protein ACB098_02G116300 [Castanea mollissima]|uniref:Uncharacterized protein n=1 Tax=Castanea mollissima TaxID=60419 RepID=A0A8J4R2T2_9ROSI|nr:hypothetical protein CMV_011083 [Castanea mollissima]
MGGCATKPKVLKEASAPEPAKEEKLGDAVEPLKPQKDLTVKATEKIDIANEVGDQGGEGEGDKSKEIIDDDKVDEQGNKRRSLSLLFKQNEEGKDSTVDGNPAVEPLKQEEPSVDKKPTEESETKLSEVEKSDIPPVQDVDAQNPETPIEETLAPVFDTQKHETPVELTPIPVVDAQGSETPVPQTHLSEFVNAPEKAETEEKIEIAPTEAPDVASGTEKAIEPAPAVESQTNGTSEEKKIEASDDVASAYEEAKTLKPIEAAVGTESQKDVMPEENKTESKESTEVKANV